MNGTEVTARDFRYDAFISYSRKDRNFAGRLERELRSYHPPKDLAVPQRRLRVFRDEEDFTGGEYHDSLDRCLRASDKLIVICSPNSASSPYVADEIRRFAEQRGKDHIIPILLDGIPNNEVKESDQAQGAFPEELLRVLPMPLAADYRGFNPKGDRFRKGTFAHAWFKTIADVYADHGIDRAAVEQRERRRELRRLRNLAVVSSSVALALIALTIWALLSRSEAARQRDNSEARRYEAEARLVFGGAADALTRATLFSVTSVRFAPTIDGHLSLARFVSLLPRPPLWRQVLEHHAEGFGGGRRKALAFSPDGRRIASIAGDGPLQMLDARTGAPVRSIELERQPADRTVAAFSPDGRFLVVGCGPVACVVDATSDRFVTRLPRDENLHGSMVWAAAFSPDGQHLAVSSYGSGEVLIYEVPTWRTLARVQAGSGTVFSVAFSPDGQWLVTAAPEGLQVWPRAAHYAAAAGQARTSDLVWSIAFHPDSGGIVTGSRTVQAWRIVPGDAGAVQLVRAAAAPIEAHTVLPVAWHGRTCVAAATPDAVHLLCGDALDEVVRIPVSSTAATISIDRRVFLNEQTDGTLAAWSLDAGLESFRLNIGSPVRSIATSDGRNWLAAGMDTGVVVVALDTWSERMRVRLPAPVTLVNASGDGRWLVVAEAASVHIYDATSWREAGAATPAENVRWAGFDRGDRSLLIVTGKTLVVLQPGDWRERMRVDHDERVTAVNVSPDGGRLATVTQFSSGGHDGGVSLTRVFEISTGTELAWEYKTGGSSNISLAFMEAEAARRKRTVIGGATEVRTAAASWPALELSEPSERVSDDNAWKVHVSGSVAELIDGSASRPVAALDQAGEITGARFVPSSAPSRVITAGEDGTLAIWPIAAADLADDACLRLQAILGAAALGKLISEGHLERSCGVGPLPRAR